MAEKFKFSLEKLLEIRDEKEKESVRLFKGTQDKLIAIEGEIEKLNDQYDNYKIISQNENAAYQKIKRKYVEVIGEALKEKEKERKSIINELEIRRKDLLEKQREKKTVEVIKDKKYKKFIEDLNKKEQTVIDELGLYAFIRNDDKMQ